MVQDHHGAVLGPPQRVKLVVVALAQGQEGLRGEQQQGAGGRRL